MLPSSSPSFHPPRRLVVAFAFVAALFVAGVAGFVTLEHESLIDAVLTTISAISTVGYSPPRPLSAGGKLLAVALIVGGLIGIALLISVLTEYFMEGHLYGAWERRQMDRAVANLRDHYIISGFGRVGREVTRIFGQAAVPFVVVDTNPNAVAAARSLGYLCLEEDASHDEVLMRAGIARARGLVACADSDTNNVYVTLTARVLNPSIFIVARAAQEDAEPKLYKAGADRVVSPYVMAGRHMAHMAADPVLSDYHNLIFDGKQFNVGIQELRTSERPDLVGQTVRQLHRQLGGAFVLAVDRGAESIRDVGPDLVVEPDDRLLIVGSGDQLSKLSTIR